MRAAATAAIASLTPTMLSWQWCVCFEAMGTRVVVRNTQLRVSAEWCTLLDSLSKEKKSIRASPFTMLLMFYHTYERRLEREGWCKSIHSNCLQLLHDWVVSASCNCVSRAADLDTHILNRYWANARWRHQQTPPAARHCTPLLQSLPADEASTGWEAIHSSSSSLHT